MSRSSDPGGLPRFLVAGAANTVATYLLYLALLQFMGYAAAYSISYVAGIALAYAVNSLFVFRAPMSLRSAVRFPFVYVFQYLAGLGLMWVQVDLLSVPAWLAPWITTALLMPATYLISRRALLPKVTHAPCDNR